MSDDAKHLRPYQFAPGNKVGGRFKGSRNKLGADFLYALQREFEAHGEGAIRIARMEKPIEFLKLIAATLPKEFELVDSRMKEIPDHELDALLNLVRRRAGVSKDGVDETTH
jgi:hypothetical protein